MTRKSSTLIVLAALAVGLAPTAHAEHTPDCPSTYGYIIPEDGYEKSYPVYVVVDELNSNDYLFSIWIYAETNGEPGLQRCDPSSCYDPQAGPCDTPIF